MNSLSLKRKAGFVFVFAVLVLVLSATGNIETATAVEQNLTTAAETAVASTAPSFNVVNGPSTYKVNKGPLHRSSFDDSLLNESKTYKGEFKAWAATENMTTNELVTIAKCLADLANCDIENTLISLLVPFNYVASQGEIWLDGVDLRLDGEPGTYVVVQVESSLDGDLTVGRYGAGGAIARVEAELYIQPTNGNQETAFEFQDDLGTSVGDDGFDPAQLKSLPIHQTARKQIVMMTGDILHIHGRHKAEAKSFEILPFLPGAGLAWTQFEPGFDFTVSIVDTLPPTNNSTLSMIQGPFYVGETLGERSKSDCEWLLHGGNKAFSGKCWARAERAEEPFDKCIFTGSCDWPGNLWDHNADHESSYGEIMLTGLDLRLEGDPGTQAVVLVESRLDGLLAAGRAGITPISHATADAHLFVRSANGVREPIVQYSKKLGTGDPPDVRWEVVKETWSKRLFMTAGDILHIEEVRLRAGTEAQPTPHIGAAIGMAEFYNPIDIRTVPPVVIPDPGFDFTVSIVDTQINNLLSNNKVSTSYNPAPVADAPAGVFTISATFTNIASGDIRDIFFEVAQLTGGNVLLNADGGPAGEGAILRVDAEALGPDGRLNPGESFTVDFEIGLKRRQPFGFYVDAFGTPGDGPVMAPMSMGSGENASFDFEIGDDDFTEPTLYLPFVIK